MRSDTTTNIRRRGAATTAALPLVILIALLLGSVAAGAVDRDVERPLTEQAVTDVVERELLYDLAVSSNRIDVETADGIVTLTGSVDNILAKERATRIAEAVKGVRSVVNRIQVLPPVTRTDFEIERDVERALLEDPATDSYEVGVAVNLGKVTLDGTVQSWREKELAGTVAKGVRGVTGLDNQIDVEYVAERPDREIQKEIDQALRTSVLIDDALIDVSVDDGQVTLSGTVGSASEKRLARYEAWTAGVHSVDDSGLEVERWARDEDLRKDKYIVRSDEEIRESVEDALLRDPRVYAFDVDVSADGGIVTLRGVVDNLKAKRAAEQDASNTVGVATVRNHLKVRPVVELADEAIEQEVRDALLRDPFVSRYQVGVDVYDGIAYLSGTVDSYFEKAQADDVTARVGGVVDVVNNLDVEDDLYAADPYVDTWDIYDYDWYDFTPSYTFKSDWEIRRDIENELFWSPFVDADEVTVTVEDGIATLTGEVDSWMERGAARDNAYEAGATYVRNELQVN